MKTLKISILALLSLILSNCNQIKLEKEEARALVEKTLGVPAVLNLQLGADKRMADLLQQNGLLTCEWEWEDRFGMHSYDYKFECTEKGKPYYNGSNSFRACDMILGTIDGISINKEDQTAIIRFSLVATEITPVAFALENTKYLGYKLTGGIEGELVYKKFDTGWQLQSGNDKSEIQLLNEILSSKK